MRRIENGFLKISENPFHPFNPWPIF